MTTTHNKEGITVLYHVELVGPNGGKTVTVRAGSHVDAIEAATRANPGLTYTGRFATSHEEQPEEAEVVEEGDE